MISDEELKKAMLARGLVKAKPVKNKKTDVGASDEDIISAIKARNIDTRTPESVMADQAKRVNELPELSGLLAGEDKLKVAAIAPALLTATDEAEMAKILTGSFPNIGIQQTPEGEILARNNRDQESLPVHLNKPGISRTDILQGLGIMAAYYPASAASIGANTLKKKIVTGALASGATQAGIEGIQAASGGNVDPEQVPLASVLGIAGELVAPALSGIKAGGKAALNKFKNNPAEDLVENVPEAIAAQQGVEQATGKKVSLYPAQKTVDRSMMDRQDFLLRAPQSSKMAADALKKQNEEAYNATLAMIDTLAGDQALETGSVRFHNAAKAAIESKKKLRAEIADPKYQDAWKKNPNVSDAKNYIASITKSMMEDFSEGTGPNKAIKEISKIINDSKNLRQLHSAKRHLDEMIDGSTGKVYGTDTLRALTTIKENLLREIDAVSPDYKMARESFEKSSINLVNPVENSLVGSVARMTEKNMEDVSGKIFNPRMSVYSINKAKQMINDVDPMAWDELLRVEAQKRLAGIKETDTPAELKKALFGNRLKRSVFLGAMNPTQRTNFLYLEEVLGRASAGRALNSHTDSQQAIRNILSKSKLIAGMKAITSPLDTMSDTATQKLLDKNTQVLAKAMFDPDWSGKFSELATKKDSPATAKAMIQLLKEVANNYTEKNEDAGGNK